MHNFPKKNEVDYNKILPYSDEHVEGGADDELIINIRGGDILSGIHTSYVMIPPEFYHYCIEKSGKKPVFYGQLDDSPYMREIRERFPDAKYIPSRGANADFNFIRRSKHIVTCVSTFSWLAAWLSDAQTIYFPIAGVINPGQNPGSMLIPFNDPRYRLFLFPVYFGGHIDQYRSWMDPIRGAWREVDDSLFKQQYPDEPTMMDRALACLDPDAYVREYPEMSHIKNRFGISGLINHFMRHGFFEGKSPVKFDASAYYRAYPTAAWDVASGRYQSALDHYIQIGHQQGLRIHDL